MNKYLVKRMKVESLWGNRNFDVAFHDDINIIIGPNASGKTTLINILHHSLTANLAAISQLDFDRIVIGLCDFQGERPATIEIRQSEDSLTFEFENHDLQMPLAHLRESSRERDYGFRRRPNVALDSLRTDIASKIPAVWLPVSRRLPISEEDDIDRRRPSRHRLESVDECLGELLESLATYRVQLDSELAELRKDFQKHALQLILFDKLHDCMPVSWKVSAPSPQDQDQLLRAYAELGFDDTAMLARINEHFDAAQQAAERLKSNATEGRIDIDTLFILPLINRTKKMVQHAQELADQQHKLFASLRRYENLVSSFLTNKLAVVGNKGTLEIKHVDSFDNVHSLQWRHLSSGEKQILILLTQALLWEKDPVLYVADEPELSLHVTWQEKLIKSLRELAGTCQLIVATHSPDIAGEFHNKIINLARL